MILNSMIIIAGGIMAALDTGGAGDICAPLDVREIQVGGEIGRRLQATVDNNLLVIALDQDFLAPFQKHDGTGGYVGLGKTLDAFARFAAYTGDSRIVERKQHLVSALLQSQGPDGRSAVPGFCNRSTQAGGVADSAGAGALGED